MTKRILFVDDEFNVLAAIKRRLHKRFQIEMAKGGQDAVSRLNSPGRYAVIVADLRMPTVDGFTLLARARELAPNVVRVMLTGQADLASAMRAVNEVGVFRFLLKPADVDVLEAALDDRSHGSLAEQIAPLLAPVLQQVLGRGQAAQPQTAHLEPSK